MARVVSIVKDMMEGLPDIDLDFPQSRRTEVIDYLAERYGQDHISAIGTRMVLGAKSAVTDVGRALGVPLPDVRAITKILDASLDVGARDPRAEWERLCEVQEAALRPWRERHPSLFSGVDAVVGVTRQAGKHPAGIVVADAPMIDVVPMRARKGEISTQFDGPELESLGLVKLDILGLRHLDTLQQTREMVAERHGVELDFYEFGDEQYADPAIWPAMWEGNTLGIFQLESSGGTKATVAFRPEHEYDVMDLVSINRPGVIDAGMLKPYLDRRAGLEDVQYDHPMVEEHLSATHGIIVYQESVSRIAMDLAGLSADEAEALRKVLAKKAPELLPPFYEMFRRGCLANPEFVDQSPDEPKVVVDKIWSSIEAGGRYSFAKAHAIAYAMISSWEVWLKHYYYPEFITALMRTDPEKIKSYVQEARSNGLSVLPPDVNDSGSDFTLTEDGIRFGLSAVRQVGGTSVKEIIARREEGGPFASLEDFLDRCAARLVNVRVVANLISIGAFDSLDEDRGKLLGLLYSAKKTREVPEIPDFEDPKALTEIEEHLLGIWITHDPLGPWADMIDGLCLSSKAEIADHGVSSVVRIGGQITSLRPHRTKRGDPMAFVDITRGDEVFSLLVFPDSWRENKAVMEVGAPVICRAIVLEDGAAHITATQRLDWLD